MTRSSQDRLMTADGANRTSEDLLTLRSEMSDLALVPAWIEHLAAEYALPPNVQFAMNLCLEEVLSNVIRHGYGSKPDHPIFIHYTQLDDKTSLLQVDDEAPHFNPLLAEPPVEESLSGNRIGGLGIRLLRSFAANLRYEPTPVGNRLAITFSATS